MLVRSGRSSVVVLVVQVFLAVGVSYWLSRPLAAAEELWKL